MKAYNLRIGITLVVANMIGAGVFTTVGLQLAEISDPAAVMLTWLIGGIIAISGAIAYARLAMLFPRSGGEYNFLRKIYNEQLGFTAGILSILAGFAAPMALTSIALGEYLHHYISLQASAIGIIAIIVFTFIHIVSVKAGGEIHFGITIFKLVLIGVFIVQGFRYGSSEAVSSNILLPSFRSLTGPGFSVALLFAVFSYTGWNATCYVIDEMKSPRRNILWSLVIGSVSVTLIYILLNYTFLMNANLEEITGMIDIGNYIGIKIFGRNGGVFFTAMISLVLISSISGLIVGGSRVTKVMGEDYPWVRKLATVNSKEVPVRALIFQSVVAIGILLTFTFETILTYTGFTLILFSFVAVLGNLKIRSRSRPSVVYKLAIWIYLIINTLLIIYIVYAKWETALISLGIITMFYLLSGKIIRLAR